jgi:ribonuclease D
MSDQSAATALLSELDFDAIWVETPEALAAACAELEGADWLALDTEFIRESTFFPIPALVQLMAARDGELPGAVGKTPRIFLIDPTVVPASDALKRLLGPEGPLKLLHACGEDMEVFLRWAGVAPAPLIDTQIAEGLTGGEASMGYQRLVERVAGITVPKEETRSNWLKRPLSQAQCDYAALDVLFLPQVWAQQREALNQLGRMAWLEEDCSAPGSSGGATPDPEYWKRHRSLWKLTPRGLAAWQSLCEWREAQIRLRDVPRSRLLADAQLFAICERLPVNRFELAKVEGLHPPQIKRIGDSVLEILKDVAMIDDSQLPRVPPSPLAPEWKARMKRLKREVNAVAEAQDLKPEILGKRRDMEALVIADYEGEPLPLPGGWRGALLAERLAKAFQPE